jgi:hypothetical protein
MIAVIEIHIKWFGCQARKQIVLYWSFTGGSTLAYLTWLFHALATVPLTLSLLASVVTSPLVLLSLFVWLVLIFETPSHYVTQVQTHHMVYANLKLVILLPQPPRCWNCRCAPPCLTCIILMRFVFFCLLYKQQVPPSAHLSFIYSLAYLINTCGSNYSLWPDIFQICICSSDLLNLKSVCVMTC